MHDTAGNLVGVLDTESSVWTPANSFSTPLTLAVPFLQTMTGTWDPSLPAAQRAAYYPLTLTINNCPGSSVPTLPEETSGNNSVTGRILVTDDAAPFVDVSDYTGIAPPEAQIHEIPSTLTLSDADDPFARVDFSFDFGPGLELLGGVGQVTGFGQTPLELRANLAQMQSTPCLPPGAQLVLESEWGVRANDGLLEASDTGFIRIAHQVPDDAVTHYRYQECLAVFDNLVQPANGLGRRAPLHEFLCPGQESGWCHVLGFMLGQGGITDPIDLISRLLDELESDPSWISPGLISSARSAVAQVTNQPPGAVLAVCLARLLRERNVAVRATDRAVPPPDGIGWSIERSSRTGVRLSTTAQLPVDLPAGFQIASPLMVVSGASTSPAGEEMRVRFAGPRSNSTQYRVFARENAGYFDATDSTGPGFAEAIISPAVTAVIVFLAD